VRQRRRAIMQSDNRFLDDLARVASGALGALTGVREEVEARLRDQFQRILDRMDLVRREEFEAVQAMAAKARAEQERLAERVAALEAALAAEPRRKSGRGHAAGDSRPAPEDAG
ncbi:MAG TPA: accessory factor UbiK family protein, partial [Stellaceae bacterium]|nr:accessory factor UbiK family protein [Stellaceae bacterium]